MLGKRSLTDDQEKALCAAYLCGVGARKLGEHYGVSPQLVTINILGDRMKRLYTEHPLVGFYYGNVNGRTPGRRVRQRERNSAHFVLAYSGQHVENRELAVPFVGKDGVYELVYGNMYSPRTARLLDSIDASKIPVSRDPLEKLLEDVLEPLDGGNWPGRESVEERMALYKSSQMEKLLLEVLFGEYKKADFNLKDVYSKLKSRLLNELKEEADPSLSDLKAGIVHELLGKLPRQERESITEVYGLKSGMPRALRTAGLRVGLSPQGVKNYAERGIERLRLGANLTMIRLAASSMSDDAIVEKAAMVDRGPSGRGLFELGMDIRKSNRLEKVGVRTFTDLLEWLKKRPHAYGIGCALSKEIEDFVSKVSSNSL